MFKGFYNLTSGMLTQQRNLNVVGNNMVNVSTAGFKKDQYLGSTFDEVMYSRVGNKDNSNPEEIGQQSYILTTSQVYPDFTQGVLEPTGIPLDFAIEGEGFFAVQKEGGEVAYTRSGGFSLDDEGYLCLSNQGRVLDDNGNPFLLMTDKVQGDGRGGLFTEDGGYLGQLGVYRFEDYTQLKHDGQGMFTGAQGQLMGQANVYSGHLERSNVDMIDQMTEMMTCQRALQSAAQMTKMYDQLMSKATTELGRL